MVNAAFWQGKKVFLTGHTGFKGSWLSLWLKEMGAVVVGFSLPAPTQPSLFEVARLEQWVDVHHLGDVRHLAELQAAIKKAQPDIVIHMAAQPLVRLSYDEPVSTYETNVMGSVNLLEAVRHQPSVRVVLMVTSDKCYENREWLWGYREDEAMGGYDPYSNSKGCAELVVSAYRRSFFHQPAGHAAAVASVRAGNVIGGGDWAADRLIPDMVRAFLAGQSPLIRRPDSIRPWQHVLEPLSGYLLLAKKLWENPEFYAEGWNFGPQDSDAKPVRWIADVMANLWSNDAAWMDVSQQGDSLHEAHYLKLDCSKARMQLGWQPRLDLAAALEKTIEWYKSYGQKQDMRSVSLTQINDYMGGGCKANHLAA
ncbi:MAG: CDP-glucose 4,6-dehydratase [Alphaproteobacteria bacterium]